MYINNGIAYAGDPKPPIKIIAVRPLDRYRLWVRFNTGEAKIFDFTDLLGAPAFAPLRDVSVFNSVYIDYGCTVWDNGNVDIAPEFLYANSVKAEEN